MQTTDLLVPEGFVFTAVSSGLKYKDRNDLALILSKTPASSAGVFTRNLFVAAPVIVAKEFLQRSPTARGILINAGQANACTGQDGVNDCLRSLEIAADSASTMVSADGTKKEEFLPRDILPASTGVIGMRMPMDVWESKIGNLLSCSLGKSGPVDAARAIMTTDTQPKLAGEEVIFETSAKRTASFKILGMAKGSGMICPDMATMIGVILCDVQIETDLWRTLLGEACRVTFNRISVDGDTSTNDCVLALANGASKVNISTPPEIHILTQALERVCKRLAQLIVDDGEGATKTLLIRVNGAIDDEQASSAARTVGHSPLVKTAMFGRDANWGRIVAALGRSGASFNPKNVSLRIGGVEIFNDGRPLHADSDYLLEEVMAAREITIEIGLGEGAGSYEFLTCDLSYDYIKINADYRS